MTTYTSGATAKFTFEFFVEGSDTVLENQDSVKFYVIDLSTNTIIYETNTLTNTGTGTYVIYYTMPFHLIDERKKYRYKTIGMKDSVQTVKSEQFYVQ